MRLDSPRNRHLHLSTMSSGAAPRKVTSLPEPLDLSHYYSRVTNKRYESSVKQFYKYFAIPGIGNLAGGLPNAQYFPFETLESNVALPERFEPSAKDGEEAINKKLAATKLDAKAAHIKVPYSSPVPNPFEKVDVTTALQYGQASGFPPLLAFIRQFTRENLHPNVPYAGGPEVILTNGSTDGMSKALECFTNVWDPVKDWISDREGVLCEEFAYMNAIQQIQPRGLNVVPVKIDGEGIVPWGKRGLEDTLANWDSRRGRRPHLLYTVTIGQNPTSGTLSTERRQKLYDICSKYDVVIIEDDPYWYLQFPSASTTTATPFNLQPGKKSSGFEFLDSLLPSYLSIDRDGRVIRLDTFSKTVAPGCRLGWITAQPKLIERILRITEATTQQPSGFVQAMVAQLIMGPQHSSEKEKKKSEKAGELQGWKVDGWVRWLEGLRGEYERRMQGMCAALEQGRFTTKQQKFSSSSRFREEESEDDWAVVSKIPMFSFVQPRGGMFVWIQFHLESHPLFNKIDHERLAKALWIWLTMKPYRVLVAPGSMFSPTDEVRENEGWKYVRLCFAAIDREKVEGAGERFAQGCEAFWGLRKVSDVEEIERGEGGDVVTEETEQVLNLGYIC